MIEMMADPLASVGLAALLVISPLWQLSRHTVTVVHEAGHALVALFLGGSGVRVKVHASSNGATDWEYDALGDREVGVVPLLAGYPAPSLAGLGGAVALHYDQVQLALGALVVAMVLTLMMVRNVFGALVTLATAGPAFMALHYGQEPQRVAVLGLVTWLLLLGGARDALSLYLRHTDEETDADFLAEVAALPAGFWRLLFALVSGGALAAAVWVTFSL